MLVKYYEKIIDHVAGNVIMVKQVSIAKEEKPGTETMACSLPRDPNRRRRC